MARHETFTGRSERVSTRDRYLHGLNANLNNVKDQGYLQTMKKFLQK